MANDSYGTFIPRTNVSYDPLSQGHMKRNRYCTNKFWLITFGLFHIVWLIVAIFAFSNGNVQKLIVPIDNEGRKCGIDSDVQDKPYLIFFDLTKCINGTCDTTQVCQANCPNEDFLYQRNITSLDEVKKNIICKIEINKDIITSWDQLELYITQEKCAKWYLKSKSVINRCIPKTPVPIEFNSTITNDQLQNAIQTILQIASLEKKVKDIYHDIISTGYPVLGLIALSGVASFIYIILLKWLVKPFVYVSILIICALLVYFIYESSVQYFINNSSNWLYVLIFCIVLLTIVVLSTFFFRQKIYLACQIIKESSKAITCIWSSLFFPLIPWMLHLLVLVLALSIFFYLKTITIPNYEVYVQESVNNSCICPPQLNYINNTPCDPELFKSQCKDINGGSCLSSGCYAKTNTVPLQIYIYHMINTIAFIWISFFVSAFGKMVLALTFATWYWSFNKRSIPNFTIVKNLWITFRYHIGTLAFGSLITWICDVIRTILKPISGNSQSNGPMNLQSINCIRLFIDSVLSFIQYINHNAYIMCALHGTDFCRSAKDAFNLITRNIIRVVVITNIADWILKIAKCFIVGLTVGVTIGYYSNKAPEIVNSVEVPAILALVGSYIITTAFFSVYKAAVDTLFLCFLEDSECNDGSEARPYYMSMRLKQLLKN